MRDPLLTNPPLVMNFYSNFVMSQTTPFCSQSPTVNPPHPYAHPSLPLPSGGYNDHTIPPYPYAYAHPVAAYYSNHLQPSTAAAYTQPANNQEVRAPSTVYKKVESLPDARDKDAFWDINDKRLPKVVNAEVFVQWPEGHCQHVYRKGGSDCVRKHASGWAMRNTNNHNKHILKKSCLGVMLCTALGCTTVVRPAICDKVRRLQEGRPCTRRDCEGRLKLWPCRGHNGYPVTHFWRQCGDLVYFQAKGCHDHVRPELKAIRNKSGRTRKQTVSGCTATASSVLCSNDQQAEKSAISPTDPYYGVCDSSYGMAQVMAAAAAAASYTHLPRPNPYAPQAAKSEQPITGHPVEQWKSGGSGSWSTDSPPCTAPPLATGAIPTGTHEANTGLKLEPTETHVWPYHLHSSTPMRSYEFFPPQPRAAIPFNLNGGSSLRSSSGTSTSSERRLS